jgi:hypothetical protein
MDDGDGLQHREEDTDFGTVRRVDSGERIRELLVRGDNRLKQGHDARALSRARQSYEEALRVAAEAGVEDRVRPLVEARLSDLGRLAADGSQRLGRAAS